nr:hypothetical protein [Tanacetum cinerariifolium]
MDEDEVVSKLNFKCPKLILVVLLMAFLKGELDEDVVGGDSGDDQGLNEEGKKHGRMMLDSIDIGPLVYPTIEEDGQTRLKKYFKLTEAQQLQDDCEVQATNIILHGLPPNVYALVNHQEVAKDI